MTRALEPCQNAFRKLANWQACFQPLSSPIPVSENDAFSRAWAESANPDDFRVFPSDWESWVRDRRRWSGSGSTLADRTICLLKLTQISVALQQMGYGQRRSGLNPHDLE
jgi:hypothetical protein